MGRQKERREGKDVGADVRTALERVLSHAESHGEAYDGATADHALLRAALTDEELPADHRDVSTEETDDVSL